MVKHIYYSYAVADQALQIELDDQLAALKRDGLISTWDPKNIAPGDLERETRDYHLEQADIILFLVSPDSVNSADCIREFENALARQRDRQAQVVLVHARPMMLSAEFAEAALTLPDNGKSVTQWQNRDAAWRNVARGIKRVISGASRLLESGDEPLIDRSLRVIEDEYLATFHARDPELSATDMCGICEPFVDLPWERRSPENVDHDKRKPSGLLGWTMAQLSWPQHAQGEGAAAALAEVFSRGKLPHPGVRMRLPWIVHGSPGGGKTTTVLRALAEVARHRAQQLPFAPLPVYIRLAGISQSMLDKWTQVPPSVKALRSFFVDMARDCERLKELLKHSEGESLAVVLDGLDEIADRRMRSYLLEWLLDSADKFCYTHSLVLTCRTLDLPTTGQRIVWRRLWQPNVQYMFLSAINRQWQEVWIKKRLDSDASTSRWLLKQIARLRSSSLDDPRLTRTSFFNSPFLFVGLQVWLLRKHLNDPHWEPDFPEHGDALTCLVIEHSLSEAILYIKDGHPTQADQSWQKIRTVVMSVLSQLALGQLLSPSRGWDLPETQVIEALQKASQNLSEEERSLARLVLDKSRLLSRIDSGLGQSSRAFAHPLILENLGAQQIALLVENQPIQEASTELRRVADVVWSARCLPAAVRLLSRDTMPTVLFDLLLSHLLSNTMRSELDALVPADARTILFESLRACRDSDLIAVGRSGGPQLARALIDSIDPRLTDVSERDLEGIILVIAGTLQWQSIAKSSLPHQEPSAQLAQYCKILGSFAATLRHHASREAIAKTLARLWECILSLSEASIKLTQQHFAINRRISLRGGRNWPRFGSTSELIEKLSQIEAQPYCFQILRNLSKSVLMTSLNLIWITLGLLILFFAIGLALFIHDELLQFIMSYEMIALVSILGNILFSTALTVSPLYVIVSGRYFSIHWIRRRWHRFRLKASMEKIWAAAALDDVDEEECLYWIKVYADQFVLDENDAITRISLLEKAHSVCQSNSSKERIAMQLRIGADTIRHRYQTLRQEQLQGQRGAVAISELKEQQQFVEPLLADELIRDNRRITVVDGVTFLVVTALCIGLHLIFHEKLRQPFQPFLAGLAGSLVFAIPFRFVNRHKDSPGDLSKSYLPLWYSLSEIGMCLIGVILVIDIKIPKGFEYPFLIGDINILHTNIIKIAQKRMINEYKEACIFLAFYGFLTLLIRIILQNNFLEIPRKQRDIQRNIRLLQMILISGIGSSLFSISVPIAQDLWQGNANRLPEKFKGKSRINKYSRYMIGDSNGALAEEVAYVEKSPVKKRQQKAAALQKVFVNYLHILCKQATLSWEDVNAGLNDSSYIETARFASTVQKMKQMDLLTDEHKKVFRCLTDHACPFGVDDDACKTLLLIQADEAAKQAEHARGRGEPKQALELELQSTLSRRRVGDIESLAAAMAEYKQEHFSKSYELYQQICAGRSNNERCAGMLFRLTLLLDSPDRAVALAPAALTYASEKERIEISLYAMIASVFLDQRQNSHDLALQVAALLRERSYLSWEIKIPTHALQKENRPHSERVKQLLDQLDLCGIDAMKMAAAIEKFAEQLK